jgi:hypothetical protein
MIVIVDEERLTTMLFLKYGNIPASDAVVYTPPPPRKLSKVKGHGISVGGQVNQYFDGLKAVMNIQYMGNRKKRVINISRAYLKIFRIKLDFTPFHLPRARVVGLF